MCVQYREGAQYLGGCSVPWRDIMSTVGDIMINVGDILSTVGGNLLLFEYPTVLNTPTVLMISPHMYHDIPPHVS